uniref:Deaminase n=1 Tax=Thermosporothrix sp. COM3 TaxID=2490863 RepID=A0A455SG31_9CHLR|nr:deaminase [Thermosporothrix sp. COM3]
MKKLVYYIVSTLDGFIAGPDHQFDFFTANDHFPYLIEEFPETFPVQARAPLGITAPNKHFDTVLMGRGTYTPGLNIGITSPYPQLRQVVFSSSIAPETEPTIEFASGDALKRVRELKQEEGLDIWLCGGGNLAYQLLPEIDELIVKLNPLVVGQGIPLFAGPFQLQQFQLVSTKTFASGVLILHYARQ